MQPVDSISAEPTGIPKYSRTLHMSVFAVLAVIEFGFAFDIADLVHLHALSNHLRMVIGFQCEIIVSVLCFLYLDNQKFVGKKFGTITAICLGIGIAASSGLVFLYREIGVIICLLKITNHV